MSDLAIIIKARRRAAKAQPVSPDDPRIPEPIRERIRLDPDTGCWHWTGATQVGRAIISMERNRKTAVRSYIWAAIHGALPKGTYMPSVCGARQCVSPNDGHARPIARSGEARGSYGSRPSTGERLGIPPALRFALETDDYDRRRQCLEREGYDMSLMVPPRWRE